MCKELYRHTRGMIAAALLASAALSVSACTPDDTNKVLTGIDTACVVLPIGTQIAVQVASNIGGVSIPTTIGGQITQDVSSVCAGVTQAVSQIIQRINAEGGTATVTVETKTPRGVRRLHKMVFSPTG